MVFPNHRRSASFRHGALLLALSLFAEVAPADPLGGEVTAYVAAALSASPSLQASRAEVAAAEARLRGASRPLFNPTLSLEYENGDSESGTIGVSQTLDWHRKGVVRRDAAESELAAMRGTHRARREALAAKMLEGVVTLDGAARQEGLAEQRVRLLERLVRLHERRAAAGEIGQDELILARLALSEAHLLRANAGADRLEAKASLHALSGTPPTFTASLPEHPDAPRVDASLLHSLATNQPEVREARLRATTARGLERAAQRERWSDPSVGLRAKREGDDTIIGIDFELPLHLRNDFVEEVQAVGAEALQAEQEALQTYREVLARLGGASARLKLAIAALKRWERGGAPDLRNHRRLLDRLWQGGELTTAEYLLQLQQALDSRASSEMVRTTAWRAWVDWLSASGSVQRWLGVAEEEKR